MWVCDLKSTLAEAVLIQERITVFTSCFLDFANLCWLIPFCSQYFMMYAPLSHPCAYLFCLFSTLWSQLMIHCESHHLTKKNNTQLKAIKKRACHFCWLSRKILLALICLVLAHSCANRQSAILSGPPDTATPVSANERFWAHLWKQASRETNQSSWVKPACACPLIPWAAQIPQRWWAGVVSFACCCCFGLEFAGDKQQISQLLHHARISTKERFDGRRSMWNRAGREAGWKTSSCQEISWQQKKLYYFKI